ncbi:NAD(P)-binding protein [Hypoxylon fragiforme]|uniref:NAD(P)-binding protein n=1 Tax=Hypoxylon fragiforme TaxID=63214 RepID=UPI0020C6B672|nr:NAD(P)-binding protein [Hypoxylon fragiforme]KAI2609925.1 NAD(P)-binding protein [Hypoxylon fragiforme]
MCLSRLYHHISQAWPPRPKFTDKDIPPLDGKVYVISGANTGIGKILAQILYSKNARVIITARSQEKGDKTIEDIKREVPVSKGELIFVRMDLADLNQVKTAAHEILQREDRINVLFNNAGVMVLKGEPKTVQGYEEQLGVNNVGTHLFTQLLAPTLVRAAQNEPAGSVRVIWVSSSGSEMQSPPGGVPMHNLDYHEKADPFVRYAISKAGVYYQGAEFARRYKGAGIVSVPLHPGILNTDLFRQANGIQRRLFTFLFSYPPIYGAYTEIFAAFAPEVAARSGEWVVPWGRYMDVRKDMKEATKSKEEGGTGIASAFWDWNEEQIRPYM